MTSRDFCFWLQGYLEISAARNGQLATLDQDQIRAVQQHLALVFQYEIDPSMGGPKEQAALDKIHRDGPFGPKLRC
jgi:hypothetical protein